MNKRLKNWLVKTIVVVFLLLVCHTGSAQNILNKNLTINVSRQRIDDVLEIISNKGNFYFSYNSSIVKKDSLVSISAANKTVKEILDQIFSTGYEYKESGNYIIIRRAPIKITVVTNKAITEDKFYVVSGYVLDNETGYMLPNASIYEKSLLASSLTDQKGFFAVRLKSKAKTAALTVSKEFYEDTTVTIEPKYDQQISIAIMPISSDDRITIVRPEDYFLPDSLKITVENNQTTTTYTYVRVDSGTVEKTGMGKFLLSSRQRIQTINLKKFFTERPFQLSVTPGLSTHGSLSPQVINNFSLNVFGGYNGGVNGVELGGLFNIDKKDVKYFQAGGKPAGTPYPTTPMHQRRDSRNLIELLMVSNFVEVFLAREGHLNKVGVNFLEKVQLPHLASIYGAMLAGVGYVLMGAGIPLHIPGVLDNFAAGKAAEYKLAVTGAPADADTMMRFDPGEYARGPLPVLERPKFLAIVSSNTLASTMLRRASGPVDGLIIESPTAGGHNAPPRGKGALDPTGQPVYGERDRVDVAELL